VASWRVLGLLMMPAQSWFWEVAVQDQSVAAAVGRSAMYDP
jgi:hypothetical protein